MRNKVFYLNFILIIFKGTMCSTELWSLKDKCEYKYMMKGEIYEYSIPVK